MDEDEAALLAELKAISNKSAASRFDENENDDPQDMSTPAVQEKELDPVESHGVRTSSGVGFGNDATKVFQENIATSSSSPISASPKLLSSGKSSELPPWKRGKDQRSPESRMDVDIVVAAAPSPSRHSEEPDVDEVGPPGPEESVATNEQIVADGGGFKSSTPSTFNGERGGAAEDAELLALLKGVSAKSGAVDRFADEENEQTESAYEDQKKTEPTATEEVQTSPAEPKRAGVPPWKQGKQQSFPSKDVEVVVAAPASRNDSVEPIIESKSGFKSSVPSTFQGDRGGPAEDEDLLALLRNVSAKSGAADRFADEGENNAAEEPEAFEQPKTAPVQTKTMQSNSPPRTTTSDELPPWKRTGQQKSSPAKDVEVVIAAPEPTKVQTETIMGTSSGFKSSTPSTYQGDRGGAAVDEELLALLKGVSAKSGAADRFASEDDAPAQEAVEEVISVPHKTKPVETSPRKMQRDALPPWKRGKEKASLDNDVDVVVTAPAPPQPKAAEQVFGSKSGFKSSTPSTFQGERGGAAEDAELLALLKGVSAGSSGADRFSEETESGFEVEAPANLIDTIQQPIPVPVEATPPSKPGKSIVVGSYDDDVVVAIPSPGRSAEPAIEIVADTDRGLTMAPVEAEGEGGLKEDAAIPIMDPTVDSNVGFKSSTPSTFTGDRGGAAEDEELLRELKAISSGSGSADRFRDESSTNASSNEGIETTVSSPTAKETKKASKRGWGFSPPWKRGKEKSGQKDDAEIEVVVAEPAKDSSASVEVSTSSPPPFVGGSIKSSLPNTFKGDRGGAAQDEELLKELQKISAGSSANRFTDSEAEGGEQQSRFEPKRTNPSPALPKPLTTSAPPPAVAEAEEIVVTREQLLTSLTDKNWKIRKESYMVLLKLIVDAGGGREPNGDVDANSILNGLDDMIPQLLLDKNANAVDAALQLALEYANYCTGGKSEERAARITSSLIKGSGFTSPRPTAAKASCALVLKLMEVGADTASIHSVIDVLLKDGLSSKKPKNVLMSSTLLLDSAISFGAACLPLAAVASALPKIVEHSNKNVRESGLKLVAEFCRSFGSKAPLSDVIDKMKAAQVKELDAMLQKQPNATAPTIVLRSRAHTTSGQAEASPADALAAMQAGAKELEAERFKARPPANVLDAMKQTDYAAKLKLAKWSEKVAALDIVLECGGEKPYKLVQPSGSVNYVPLISEMKSLLTHTHFAVVSKAMQVLAMLAEGVGEKLYPNLRPLFSKLLSLSKDKKLTKAVADCLDNFFGNVLSYDNLLESENGLPEGLDERNEKNALARTSALDFLGRCVERRGAGSRGDLDRQSAENCAKLCVIKLDDSDAAVRKAAINVLKKLQQVDDPVIGNAVERIIEDIESSNPRAYKALSGGAKKPAPGSPKKPASNLGAGNDKKRAGVAASPPKKESTPPSKPLRKEAATNRPLQMRSAADLSTTSGLDEAPPIDEAVAWCATLSIPKWDDPDDNGGILAGLESTKWQYRQEGITGLAAFAESFDFAANDILRSSSSVLSLVKEHTRGFKETNINVVRSIIELFLAWCDCHQKAVSPFPRWAMGDGVELAINKIADKKLSAISKSLLSSFCIVQAPPSVLEAVQTGVEKVRSPLAHEETLKWFNTFCLEFGAACIGTGLHGTISWLLEENKSTNIKVKRASLSALGTLHVQMGPPFQAVALSLTKDQSVRNQLEETFRDHPHDPTSQSADWPKRSIVGARADDATASEGKSSNSTMLLEIPKLDLISEIPSDCITKMCSKEGKTAWKARKAAMEDVDAALKRCNGMIDTSRIKPLVDLLRALRERLSDSQGNLKPVAARLIGLILGASDTTAQAKLGKIVYGPLINAAMNDNKKNMHDAALEALRAGTSVPALEGDGPNQDAMEPFVVALVTELGESEFKAAGIPDVLRLTSAFIGSIPCLTNIAAPHGESLGDKFAHVIVMCLTSSKSDIRSEAEALLGDSLKHGVIAIDSVKGKAGRLKPALQRSVGPVIAKLSSAAQGVSNDAPMEDPMHGASSTSLGVVEDEKPKRVPVLQRKPVVVSQPKPVIHDGRKKEQDHVEMHTSIAHPLVARAGSSGVQKSRAAIRAMTWPEYPEEPTGTTLLGSLKKAWSPLIPVESTRILFPDRGIKKQDDAMDGCELLTRALALDRAEEGCAVVEQVGMVLKWAVFVLCSKESTVGLQSLLSLFADLFDYLKDSKYEFSDAEALQVVPFLFDKASVAKGRFKDPYMDLINQLKSEDLVPLKRMGPVVCVSLIEASSRAPARIMACKECCVCVDKIGLSGIGKKGVLAAAKSLSEEKFPDNRNALLDLIELLLARMNGDMQRFARICGANLSGKARSAIEERLERSKGGSGPASATPSRSAIPAPSANSARRTTRMPNPVRSPPASMPRTSVGSARVSPKAQPREDSELSNGQAHFGDELPALELRFGGKDEVGHGSFTHRGSGTTGFSGYSDSGSAPSSPRRLLAPQQNVDPIESIRSISYSGSGADDETASSAIDSLRKVESSDAESGVSADFHGVSISSLSDSARLELGDHQTAESSVGAAASLRARLMRIREKNKVSVSASAPVKHMSEINPLPHSEASQLPLSHRDYETHKISSTAATDLDPPSTEHSMVQEEADDHGSEVYQNAMNKIRLLASKAVPLAENDSDLIACTNALKTIHAAVSNQPKLAATMAAEEVSRLGNFIVKNTNETVSRLTSLIDFGFNCHDLSFHAGMSVPLLSVALASLMALFRSEIFATKVEQDELTILIREAGKALLDPRLATSSSSTETSKLDEATSTQMVRAINKLAVQAATGSKRHISIQALLNLHLQLSLEADSGADPVFNSRLARVVNKLFTRVVKSEESGVGAFSSDSMDIAAVLCCLEDTLAHCDEVESRSNSDETVQSSRNQARVLITAILKARGGVDSIQSEMEDLGIDPQTSSLGVTLTSCASGMTFPGSVSPELSLSTSRDVASLVSALGSSQPGPEREEAIRALRRFKAEHGDDELNAHLQEVSAAFRQFVLEQLSEKPPTKVATASAASNSMSERIKSLRSKLNATEAVVQSAVDTAPRQPADISAGNIPTLRSGIPGPSPSKIPIPSSKIAGFGSTPSDSAPGPVTVKAFRERLAAAQEKRSIANVADGSSMTQPAAPSGGRAAALRARLQAVKRQSENGP